MAQQTRLDVISSNIAMPTMRTETGGPYQRQDVVFSAEGESKSFLPAFVAAQRGESAAVNGGVQVSQIVTDTSAGEQVYDPTHPDADANGYVTYPNVTRWSK